MKSLIFNRIKFLNVLALLLIFASCKKENVNPQPETTFNINDVTDTDPSGLYYDNAKGYYKLVLQPGPADGQDAWIDWNESDPIYANGNSGSLDQFKVLGWTIDGTLTLSRTLIKFDSLSKIPSNATVLGAKMFLYGLESSPVHLPQGNSYFPGSSYNSYGDNSTYVQRVTSSWDESTLTWNNQPSSTNIDESLISPSTSQWNYNASIDVTNMVKPMVKNSANNYGFMLKLTTEGIYRSMGFYSSNYNNTSKRPKIVIAYK